MIKVKKDLENDRAKIIISGDEILTFLPDVLLELIEKEKIEETDGYFKDELDNFEKGILEIYIPLNEIEELTAT